MLLSSSISSGYLEGGETRLVSGRIGGGSYFGIILQFSLEKVDTAFQY